MKVSNSMWQKVLLNLVKALCITNINDEPSNKQLFEKLQKIEEKLEVQERISSYRYGVSIGISVIGLGFGTSLTQPRQDWLVWFLVFGGLIIIISSVVENNRAINKNTARIGLLTIIIGVVISAVSLYLSAAPPVMFFIGLLVSLLGFLITIVAAEQKTRN